jgi:hypothetical protein
VLGSYWDLWGFVLILLTFAAGGWTRGDDPHLGRRRAAVLVRVSDGQQLAIASMDEKCINVRGELPRPARCCHISSHALRGEESREILPDYSQHDYRNSPKLATFISL